MNAVLYTNDMVAHVWAQQIQGFGRSNNGNYYFEGRYLYSYGRHYPVGVFTRTGHVFLNSSKSTPTTEVKHKSVARRALPNYGRDAFHMPALDEISGVIDGITESGRGPADRLPRLMLYLNANWQNITSDSRGAAWLLAAYRSRAKWPAMRAKLESKDKATKAKEAVAHKKRIVARGCEYVASPWQEVKEQAWIDAAHNIHRLRTTIKDYRVARLATPKAHKRVRAVLWAHETGLRDILSRAERDTIGYHRIGDRTKARGIVAKLRRLSRWRNDSDLRLWQLAFGRTDIDGWRATAELLREGLPLMHMPPAMREAAQALLAKADSIATERESKEKQRRDVSEARRRVRDSLRTFNQGRREYRRLVESGAWASGAPNGDSRPLSDRLRASILDSILSYVPSAEPWGANRGLALRPDIAARAKAIYERAQAIADGLKPIREALRTDMERASEAETAAARAKEERIRNMTADERRTAWESGDLANRHVADIERMSGPLLRAVGAEIVDCKVVAGTLQTSQGADVPLAHAARVFRFVRAVRDSGKPWTPTTRSKELRAGHFRIDSIAANGDFVAGCHSIQWPETERLARALDLWDCETIPETLGE